MHTRALAPLAAMLIAHFYDVNRLLCFVQTGSPNAGQRLMIEMDLYFALSLQSLSAQDGMFIPHSALFLLSLYFFPALFGPRM